MRSSPTFFETKFNLSFFFTTPAKKPRTECGCQSVAFMIAAMVVPFGCRSIPRTVSCFDEAPVGFVDVFEVVAPDAAADLAALRLPAEDRMGCECLAMRFAGFDFDLLVAIWHSLMSTTASGAATDASPAIGRGERRRNRSLLVTQAIQQRGRVMQTTASEISCSISIEPLCLRDAAPDCTGFRRPWRRWMRTLTLLALLKSSKFRAILWLISRDCDHKRAWRRGARYSHRPCALLGLGAHDPAHTYVVGERIIRQRLRDAVDLIVISALRKHQQLRFKLGQKWRISRK